ncbi:MAG: hypothetical protein ACYS3N_02975, partial [Planctomycetota bacterium]
NIENVFGRQRRHRALQPAAVERVIWIHSTNVENVRQITLFMQNKPKVKSAKINVSSLVTSKYELLGQLVIQTNKANSNPI